VRQLIAIEDSDLIPEIAVPLRFILNEFVTNSLKYAFDGESGQGGVITVDVEVLKESGIWVRLSDNDKGAARRTSSSTPWLRHWSEADRGLRPPARRQA
jgi:two-component sensor histidine kinase